MATKKLTVGQVVVSSTRRRRYLISGLLGKGGYGEVYSAHRIDRRRRKLQPVCIKITKDQQSWHRESYFGQLLARERRVIRVLEGFPLQRRVGGRPQVPVCLVQEWARRGTVCGYLERTGQPWSTRRAAREVFALLRVLERLHSSRATHRDITPLNVFVSGNGTLKLGDFGIAGHQLGDRPALLEAFNMSYVPRRIRRRKSPRWSSLDDVFQMGQLLAMLLRGRADELVTPGKVQQLGCGAAMTEIILRAIDPRARRFADARQMRQALQPLCA